MAKVTREDFLNRIREKFPDDTERISILEDFDDSFDVIGAGSGPVDYESDENPWKQKHSELLAKYEERLLTGVPEKGGDKPGQETEKKEYRNDHYTVTEEDIFNIG